MKVSSNWIVLRPTFTDVEFFDNEAVSGGAMSLTDFFDATIDRALFARNRAPEVFARRVARKLPPRTRWRVIVGHCDAAAEGARLLAALGDRIDMAESFLVETGAAIGAHAGRGALLVAVQPAPAS